jgi:hypothetical protein
MSEELRGCGLGGDSALIELACLALRSRSSDTGEDRGPSEAPIRQTVSSPNASPYPEPGEHGHHYR